MFEECGSIDRAEVVYGRDGRSRVSLQFVVLRYSATCSDNRDNLHTLCMFTMEYFISLALVPCLSQGYGTVRFESVESAQAAIEKFHGSECEGRTLTVKLDQYA